MKILNTFKATAIIISLLTLGGLVMAQSKVYERVGDLDQSQSIRDEISRIVPLKQTQITMSFAPLVKQVAPAVVNIYTTRVVQVQRSPFFDDPFFMRFFGDGRSQNGVPQERVQGALGSGVIVNSDGVIVTNNHVIGQADSIRVVLADRREYEAKVILADERTDLAVLKIDSGKEDLPMLEFYNSDDVEVGDLALAVGNPFGVGQTVTSGIVSATARTQAGVSDFQFFIQTDAAVNPGNSGGALVGMNGKLIGINTAIFSRAGESNGIGFAIPSNMVKSFVTAALTKGEVIRPWLGAKGQTVSREIADSLGLLRSGGIILDQIYENGPADKAGIKPGDVILKVGGREVLDPQGLRFRIATSNIGSRVPFRIYREDNELDLMVSLTAPPEKPPRNITKIEGRHAFQGVKVANLSPRYADELSLNSMMKGVIVIEIERSSPAARRQFVRPGDIILNINGTTISKVSDVINVLEEDTEDFLYQIRRGNRDIECGIVGNRSFYCR
jgi:Do/DeqQ family serine protease